MIENKDVMNIARLSRLTLSDEEAGLYSNQLNGILQYVEQLKELDTTGIEPTSHVLDLQNVMREDRTSACLTAEDALMNAPDPKDGFYRVPRILE